MKLNLTSYLLALSFALCVTSSVLGEPRAFHWQQGLGMTDLNTRIPAESPFFLLTAVGINSGGEIIAVAVSKGTGEPHGVLLTPGNGAANQSAEPVAASATRPALLPEHVRKLIRGRFGI